MLAHVIEELRWERTRTDARRIRLDDSQHVVDGTRTDTRARRCAADRRVGARHERIRPKIDIEHCTLCAFEQNTRRIVLHFAKLLCNVYDHRRYALAERHEAIELFSGIDRCVIVVALQEKIMQIEQSAQALLHDVRRE